MKRKYGGTLYFTEYWATMVAKAYIWQTLGVKIRSNFPKVKDVLETKESVVVTFRDEDSFMNPKWRDFYKKLKESGVKTNALLGSNAYVFKRDKTISVTTNGIAFKDYERD